MEEKELIAQLRAGSEQAYQLIFKKFKNKVFNTILHFVHIKEEAEDIMQEVFVELFLSIHEFKGQSKLSTWIYRLAVNKSLNHIRYKNRKKRLASLLSVFDLSGTKNNTVVDFNHPGVVLEQKEKAEQIYQAIDKLPENQRVVFVLHKFENLSYAEICETMKLSLSSVESLMHRAKQNLKKSLGGSEE